MAHARRLGWSATLALLVAGSAPAQTYQVPQHTRPPPLIGRASEPEVAAFADGGAAIERDRPATWTLAEHRRLTTALATLQPQRSGQADVFVVAAALDSDPVFGREAREAGRVLSRRYAASGRTIMLAGTDGTGDSALPMGSPANVQAALARVAELMDPAEDVLVLYVTAHGAPFGIVYNDADQGFGAISPGRLWTTLSQLGIANRMILVSACYSGVFVPALASDTTAIVTASSADRTSFGCQADNDWTFFGDALINRALRQPQPFAQAAAAAGATVGGWEVRAGVVPSSPQVSIGAGAQRWLDRIERRLPAATAPVGKSTEATLATLAPAPVPAN